MSEKRPHVWLLVSPHQGDNTQLRALSRALGWPVTEKRLKFRSQEPLLRRVTRTSLIAVEQISRDQLQGPWPELLLLSGRANEAPAFWVKRHAPGTKIVFVGTPGQSLANYDLVITTPQYGLPQADNVLHLDLPLHGIEASTLLREAATWKPELAGLPEPYTTLLVGGPSGPYGFSEATAAQLGREASALVLERGGSLLVTTSARTGSPATVALQNNITVPNRFHTWTGAAQANPFLGILGLGSEHIVTADSVSMMAEAVATGKPVYLFDIEDMRHGKVDQPPHWRGASLGATFFRIAMNVAPRHWTRDLRIVHQALVNRGEAAWLGESFLPITAEADASTARLSQSVLRIRALFGL